MDITKDIAIAGPHFELELSPIDQLYAAVYSRRIFAFELPSVNIEDNITTILSTSIQATVNQVPFLAGKILAPHHIGRSDGRATVVPGEAHLLVKHLSLDFADLKANGFPASDLTQDRFISIPPPLAPEPRDVCRIQLTFLRGGCFVGVSLHHHLFDGTSITHVIKLLASHCSALQKHDSYDRDTILATFQPQLDFDREAIVQLDGAIDEHLILRHYKVYDNIEARYAFLQNHPDVASGDFRLSKDSALRLKQAAESSAQGEWISTSDAVNALLWRAVMRTRVETGVINLSNTTAMAVAAEFRRKMPRPLPPGWVGNAFMVVSSEEVPVSDLIGPGGLKIAARALRKAVNGVDVPLIQSYISLARSSESPALISTKLAERFHTTGLFLSSQRGFDHANMSWGQAFGKYQGVFAPDGFPCGGFIICKPPLPDGRWELAVNLERQAMELLEKDEEWGEYTKEIGTVSVMT